MNSVSRFLNEANQIRTSVKAIVRYNNQILLLRICESSHGAGHWDLPGGGVEPNESFVDAIHREIFEETGLSQFAMYTDLERKNYFKKPETGTNIEFNYFIVDVDNQNVHLKPAKWNKNKPEHSEFKWVSKKTDIIDLPMLNCFRSVLMDFLD